MDHREGGGGAELDGEVPISHAVQAVPHGTIKAKRERGGASVDGEGGAGEGGRAQGTLRRAGAGIPEPTPVPIKHLDVG